MSSLGGSSMHKSPPDMGQVNENTMIGTNGVVSATAKYRAAGIVAAAARAERDYHLATLHLQTKLAEAAERRALTNLSATMQGPMKDDYEVAQACLNLRTDGKDGMYPHMVDPNYVRMNEVQSRRNGSEIVQSMPGGPMMHNPSYAGHHRYLNPNAPSLSMMDAHMHPLQNAQLESLPRDMHPHGHMVGGMHYMPEYHNAGLAGKRKYDPSATAEGEYTKKMKSAFQGPNSSHTTMKSQDSKKGKRPADMPRRPLSAYNFFFSEERERVLAALPDPDSKDEPTKKSNSEDKSKDRNTDDKKEDESDDKIVTKKEDESDDKSVTKKEDESDDKSDTKSDDKSDDKSVDKSEDSVDKPSTPNISEGEKNGASKNPQSNQDRLLSLRLVQHNVRRPHRKTHGKIGFKALAKLIGERWRALTVEQKIPYRKLAETDLARYKEQMEEYNRKNKWAFLQNSDNQPPKGKSGSPTI